MEGVRFASDVSGTERFQDTPVADRLVEREESP
jgi:hypothetical protein